MLYQRYCKRFVLEFKEKYGKIANLPQILIWQRNDKQNWVDLTLTSVTITCEVSKIKSPKPNSQKSRFTNGLSSIFETFILIG